MDTDTKEKWPRRHRGGCRVTTETMPESLVHKATMPVTIEAGKRKGPF